MRSVTRILAAASLLWMIAGGQSKAVDLHEVMIELDGTVVSVPLPSGFCALSRKDPLGEVFYPKLDVLMSSTMANLGAFFDCNELENLRNRVPMKTVLVGTVAFSRYMGTERVIRTTGRSDKEYLQYLAEELSRLDLSIEGGVVDEKLARSGSPVRIDVSGFTMIERATDRVLYRFEEAINTGAEIIPRISIAGRQVQNGYDIVILINDTESMRNWDTVIKQVRDMTNSTRASAP